MQIESAQGLLRLSMKPGFADRALLHGLNRLTKSPAAAVRYEMALNAWVVYRKLPNDVWRWVNSRKAVLGQRR